MGNPYTGYYETCEARVDATPHLHLSYTLEPHKGQNLEKLRDKLNECIADLNTRGGPFDSVFTLAADGKSASATIFGKANTPLTNPQLRTLAFGLKGEGCIRDEQSRLIRNCADGTIPLVPPLAPTTVIQGPATQPGQSAFASVPAYYKSCTAQITGNQMTFGYRIQSANQPAIAVDAADLTKGVQLAISQLPICSNGARISVIPRPAIPAQAPHPNTGLWGANVIFNFQRINGSRPENLLSSDMIALTYALENAGYLSQQNRMKIINDIHAAAAQPGFALSP